MTELLAIIAITSTAIVLIMGIASFAWSRKPQQRAYFTPVEEEDINKALADVPEDHPLYNTVMQLIDTAYENAMLNAAEEPPVNMAGYVGGARHLKMLRDEIEDRRNTAIEIRRKKLIN